MLNRLRLIRKLASVLLAAVMLFILAVPASAAQFSDLDTVSDYAKPAVTYLIQKGVLKGSNGMIHPGERLTRAQMVIMLVRGIGIDIGEMPSEPSFIDVPVDHFSFPYVEAALEAGIISMPENKTFNPNEEITREQMAAMLVRALGVTQEELLLNQRLDAVRALSDKGRVSSWAMDYVEFSLDYGLMTGMGGGRFAPQEKAERQQAATVIYRFMMAKENLQIIAAGFKRPIKNAELYEALKKSITYDQATVQTGITHRVERVDLTAPIDQESELIYEYYTHVSGTIQKANSDLDIQTVIIDGKRKVIQDYRMITLNGQKYYKNNMSETGHQYTEKWKLTYPGEIYEAGFTAAGWRSQSVSYTELLRNFNNRTFIKTSGTDEYGVPVTHYTVKYDRKNAEDFDLDLVLDKVLAGNQTLKNTYDLWLRIELNFSLFANNDLHSMGVTFEGYRSVPGEAGAAEAVRYQTGTAYNKIGAYLPITAPSL